YVLSFIVLWLPYHIVHPQDTGDLERFLIVNKLINNIR
ncbi:hypothetical protein A2U01_0054094, partial [Trifolium medium]|nr:hypothetical protein [Trifolium medium]